MPAFLTYDLFSSALTTTSPCCVVNAKCAVWLAASCTLVIAKAVTENSLPLNCSPLPAVYSVLAIVTISPPAFVVIVTLVPAVIVKSSL